MSVVIAQMKSQKTMSAKEIAEKLRIELVVKGKFELLSRKERGDSVLLMLERYAVFSNRYSAVTVFLNEDEHEVTADVISSEGHAAHTYFIYGSMSVFNKECTEVVIEQLKQLGFVQVAKT